MSLDLSGAKPALWLAVVLFVLPVGSQALAGAYDPLDIGKTPPSPGVAITVHDAARNRDIPVYVFLPKDPGPAPVILLSPGLGGSYENYSYLSEQWAARGYVVVSVQHPGSDDSTWNGLPKDKAMEALVKAASIQNFLLRVKDIPAVLNQLGTWNNLPGNVLFGRLNLKKVGMSGHSFGAITTQAVSGESFAMSGTVFTDPRITAALAFCPSPPKLGSPETAFGSVKIPWMLMTGTKDKSPIGDTDAAARLKVYPSLHNAPKYQLVLNNAEHSAFTSRELPGDTQPRNPNHHRVILALSTAFWDTYLRDDPAAAAWLNGPDPLSVMQDGDQWKFKLGAGASSPSPSPNQ